MQFSIRKKLSIPYLIGLVIIISALLFVWQPIQLNKEKKQFILSQTNILKTLSPSLVQNILSNDLSALHSIFENSLIIHKNEWQYIQLNNANDKKLYPIFLNKPEVSENIIKIQLPVIEDHEKFGTLFLYTDWSAEKIKQTKNINQISYWSIFIFLTLTGISYFLQTRWLYKPVTRLKDTTTQFANGNYNVKFPDISNDEIGELTTSIDHMRVKIQSSLEEITNKEKMQRAILDSVPDGIITINTRGIVQSFNPGAETIFGYSSGEVIGKNIKILMPDNFASQHDQYLSNFHYTDKHETIRPTCDLFGKRKNNSEFPMELAVTAKMIDDKCIFTGVVRDITERKKVERLKNEFVATVSHEIRTPLTAIKGSLDIITNGLNLNLPEQANGMLNVANRNVERLLSLINDILDVSKLESSEVNLEMQQFKLKPFIDDTININQEYAKKFNTTFKCTHCHDNILITADRDRLVQVMSNLLSNAAKYSPDDVPVEIFTSINENIIRVNIKDYGPGIPQDFQDKLFEKFTQSSSGDTRQVGGTGLGLNISKMIIEKMGGNIGFKTIEGKETIFYFEFPVISEN